MKYIQTKKIIIFFLISFILIGCENTDIRNKKNLEKSMEIQKMNIIHYDTKEFKNYMEIKPRISLNEAWILHQKYYKRPLNEMVYSMYFLINNYYVFSSYAEDKLMEASIEGLWIHSQTGEIKYVKDKTMISPKNQGGWSYNIFK
ncbi:MAG: hypothetical protein GY932_14455 [Arcobacter sp.]|nr:hypothetical protein [Arcobacter sp.]